MAASTVQRLISTTPIEAVAEFIGRCRLIVPFPPGGSTAHTAAVLAAALEAEFGERVALDYRVGDFGLNALRALADPGDEPVLLIGNIITASMTPVLRRESMGFEFNDRLAPVTKLAEFPSILMTSLSVPADNLDGLLRFCGQRDHRLRYGSDFLGTFVDVDAIEIGRRAGVVAALHVAGSANGVLAALIDGKTDMALLNVATAAANRGKYKPLAISGPRRLSNFPGVPTLAELGFDGVGLMQWQGLFAPRRLPAALIDGLHQAAVRAMQSEAALSAMKSIDATALTSTSPAEFATELGDEKARWESMKAQILAVPSA
jgi:tripartite-type tricarboxylate transporter receptor subunit TctC